MPYINSVIRDSFDPWLCEVRHASNSGELNYQITLILLKYWEAHGPAYQTINDIVGALESAKLEFYRRVAVPYEEEKIKQNGDVY